jgi:hypothetical protein
MIIIRTTIHGLEWFVLLVTDTEQRAFPSHAGVVTAAQEYIV